MATFEIFHDDADRPMLVEAETAPKAKYKNYLQWSEAFNYGNGTFRVYLSGVSYCRKVKKEAHNE